MSDQHKGARVLFGRQLRFHLMMAIAIVAVAFLQPGRSIAAASTHCSLVQHDRHSTVPARGSMHPAAHSAMPCCANVGNDSALASPEALPLEPSPESWEPVIVGTVELHRRLASVVPVERSAGIPHQLPYYARSARILR